MIIKLSEPQANALHSPRGDFVKTYNEKIKSLKEQLIMIDFELYFVFLHYKDIKKYAIRLISCFTKKSIRFFLRPTIVGISFFQKYP